MAEDRPYRAASPVGASYCQALSGKGFLAKRIKAGVVSATRGRVSAKGKIMHELQKNRINMLDKAPAKRYHA
ncbi:MAG: hypothetical protein DBX63_10970 [Clostridia bacterium]|nr:MAG: hypothetical protein DBX63_10970 [Clostridia bacterium]